MKVSISEAARLCGRTRQTLYTMHDRGKLTWEKDLSSGKPKIDMAELLRVFPHIKIDKFDKQNVVNVKQSLTTENEALVINSLRQQIELLERLLKEKDERIELLEYRREVPPKLPKVRRGIFDRLADGFQAALD